MYISMNKLTTLNTISLVIALAAFISPTAAKAQAVNSTTNLSIPTNILVFVPCANGGAGENVLLSGDLHVLLHFTVNDNHATIKSHFQPQGISGTGQSTGANYQATGVTQETTSFQSDGVTYEDTFVNNFRIIGQGPGNNFLVHQTFHVTFNNNGVLTAFQNNFSVDC